MSADKAKGKDSNKDEKDSEKPKEKPDLSAKIVRMIKEEPLQIFMAQGPENELNPAEWIVDSGAVF